MVRTTSYFLHLDSMMRCRHVLLCMIITSNARVHFSWSLSFYNNYVMHEEKLHVINARHQGRCQGTCSLNHRQLCVCLPIFKLLFLEAEAKPVERWKKKSLGSLNACDFQWARQTCLRSFFVSFYYLLKERQAKAGNKTKLNKKRKKKRLHACDFLWGCHKKFSFGEQVQVQDVKAAQGVGEKKKKKKIHTLFLLQLLFHFPLHQQRVTFC